MAEENQTRQILAYNIPNVLVFTFLAWGIFTTPAPLKSSRPAADAKPGSMMSTDRVIVPARLWDDPLAAIAPIKAIDGKGLSPKMQLVVTDDNLVPATAPDKALPNKNQTLLLVLLDGGPFPEQYEQRLRTRQAINDALLEDEYQTDVGDLTIVRAQLALGPVYLAHQVFVPLSPKVDQLFANGDLQDSPKKRFDKVHVFYVDEHAFREGHFYNDITQLLDELILDKPDKPLSKTEEAHYPMICPCVFGPTNSNTYCALLQTLLRTSIATPPGQPPLKHNYSDLRFYSTAPTLPEAAVRKVLCDEFRDDRDLDAFVEDKSPHPDTGKAEVFVKRIDLIDSLVTPARDGFVEAPNQKVKIFRAYGDDSELIHGLIGELNLRQATANIAQNSVALVTELDGLYGQTMRETFLNQERLFLLQQRLTVGSQNGADNLGVIRKNLHEIQDEAKTKYENAKMTYKDAKSRFPNTPTSKEDLEILVNALDRTYAQLSKDYNIVPSDPYRLSGYFGYEFCAYLEGKVREPVEDDDYRACKAFLYERVCIDKALSLANAKEKADDSTLPPILELLVQCPSLAEQTVYLRSFSYLRGIDGQSVSKDTGRSEIDENNNDYKTDKDDDKAKGSSTIEEDRPQGRSQNDYLRRLARSLNEVQGSKDFPTLHFRAIGVTGSDVYDKLLVIRALRKEFPSAVFFTTDLDASYLSPSELEFTSGLIAASRYNLQLRYNPFFGFNPDQINSRNHPISTAPFRDSYQTAVQLSCLHALSYIENDSPPNDKNTPILERREFKRPPVHIFQLNSLEFVPLLSLNDKGQVTPDDEEPSPQLMPSVSSLSYLIFFLACLLFVFGVIFWTDFLLQIKDHPWVLLVGVLVLIGCILAYFGITDVSLEPNEEPFVLWGAMSTWPSTIIRGLALLLAVGFIWKCNQVLRHNARRRGMELVHLMRQLKSLQVTNASTVYVRQRSGPLVHSNPFYEIPDSPWATALKLHEKLKTLKRRNFRAFGLWMIFMIVATIATLYGGFPADPTRGIESQRIYQAVLILSVAITIYLVFYIIDALVLCQSLILWLLNRIGDCRRKLEAQPLSSPVLSCSAQVCNDNMMIVSIAVKVIWLIADRTKIVQQFIYYPFICLLLLLFARDSHFSRYDWPLSLFVVIPIPYIILGSIVTALQIEARKARERVSEIIKGEKDRYFLARCKAAAPAPPSSAMSLFSRYDAFLEEKRAETETIQTGAYASLYASPLFQSVLIPLTGVGGIQLISFFKSYFGS